MSKRLDRAVTAETKAWNAYVEASNSGLKRWHTWSKWGIAYRKRIDIEIQENYRDGKRAKCEVRNAPLVVTRE